MKIVFITDVYFPTIGGVELTTSRLAQEFSQEDNDVYVITPSQKFKHTVTNEGNVKVMGIRSAPIPFGPYPRYSPQFLAKRRVFKILKEIDPDIIHIQTNLALAKLCGEFAKKFGIPVVATSHVIPEELLAYFKSPQFVKNLAEKFLLSFPRSVYVNADVLTTPSEMAKNYFNSKNLAESRFFSVSDGVDIDNFGGQKITSKKPIILYVGRFEPVKRIDVLIKAAAAVFKKIDAKLVLVGGGSLEKELKNLVRSLGIEGKVIFTGFLSQKEVIRYYKKATLFATSSTLETLGLATLEAAASGLPIIASRAGALPELVQNGRNGYLFTPNNYNELAKKALKILQNKKLAKKMGEESIAIAKEHDIKIVASKFKDLYQKAIAISSLKVANRQPKPIFISRGFLVKTAFAMFLLAVLFRNSLASPAVARAKGIRFRDQIKNSKVIKNIENLDLKLKTTLTKSKK